MSRITQSIAKKLTGAAVGVVCLFAGTGWAQGTYDVGATTGRDMSTDFTGSNWSWTAATSTLTLTNNISGMIRFYGSVGNVVITTNNTVSVSGGIIADNGHITINGSGTLNVTNTSDAIRAANGINISGAVSVTANSSGTGLGIRAAAGDITISTSGTVTAGGAYGIYAENNITISGGTVNANGTSRGIIAGNGNITIGGGTVTANGIADDGIWAENNITISGGTVTANGNTNGIYARIPGNITISGSGTVVTASGNTYSLIGGTINITGGTLTTSGGEIYGHVNHTGGTLNGDPPPFGVPATGLSDITSSFWLMIIFGLLSVVLWGYVFLGRKVIKVNNA